jgi:hypothetical protein
MRQIPVRENPTFFWGQKFASPSRSVYTLGESHGAAHPAANGMADAADNESTRSF